MVYSSMRFAITSRSASVVCGSMGARRHSTASMWHALSNAGCAVSGLMKFGLVMARCCAAHSRYASTACRMLPLPPDVTSPAGGAAAHSRRPAPGARRFGDLVCVRRVERQRDDLALELRHARAHVALQRVDVGEQFVGAPEELIVLVIAAIHRAGALPGLPHAVLVVGEPLELLQDRWPGSAFRRHAADDVVGHCVWIGRAH